MNAMNQKKPGDRIGIFGGAFNPVHKGHVRAAESFLKCGLIDQLLVLPTPSPPHKKTDELAGFHHRKKMLEVALNGLERVVVSDLEKELPSPSYTLQTIEHLMNQNPNRRYFLCMGEDSIVHFHKWYRYEDLLEKVTLLVAERPGFDSQTVSKKILEKTIFVDHQPIDLSSNQFRKSRDKFSIKFLPEEVARYIKNNRLYTGINE